jgi:hypothetical protein
VEAQGPPPHAKSKQTHSAARLVPILFLLIGIGTLVAGATTLLTIPSDQSEQIANLTAHLDVTKSSLNACTRNSTRLGIDLNIERVRLGVCRENGGRLAERVEKVKRDLEWCTNKNLRLEGELNDVKSREEVCETENDKLRRQVEVGAFIDFKEFVGSLGTGGYVLSFESSASFGMKTWPSFSDSWVCSDTTRSWYYGYVSEQTPHPTINIKTWTAELSDAKHSASPLVFPTLVIQDFLPVPPSPHSLSYPQSYSETTGSPLQPDSPIHSSPLGPTPLLVQRTGVRWRAALTPTDASIYIIGYAVTSENTSGNNGWWKITKMDRFGTKDGQIEFWALAAKWYGSKSLYDVKVWYIER